MGVEQLQLSAPIESRRLEHRLDADSVDEGYEQLGLALEVEPGGERGFRLSSLEHDLHQPAPGRVALVLLGGEVAIRGRVTPEGEPHTPLLPPALVERQAFLGHGAQRGAARLAPQRVEHAGAGLAGGVTQSVDQHLALVAEVVHEGTGGATRLVGDGPQGGPFEAGAGDGSTGRGSQPLPLGIVIDDLGQERLLIYL